MNLAKLEAEKKKNIFTSPLYDNRLNKSQRGIRAISNSMSREKKIRKWKNIQPPLTQVTNIISLYRSTIQYTWGHTHTQ